MVEAAFEDLHATLSSHSVGEELLASEIVSIASLHLAMDLGSMILYDNQILSSCSVRNYPSILNFELSKDVQ